MDLSEARSRRDRTTHGPKLQADLAAALAIAYRTLQDRDQQLQSGKSGVYLEVEAREGGRLPELTWKNEGITLGAQRLNEDGVEVGALFVPVTAAPFLSKKLNEYTLEDTPAGKPKNEDRFAPVEALRYGSTLSLWTDRRPFPEAHESIWWECWCWEKRARNFAHLARRLNLRVSERRLHFPDFEVVLVYGTPLALENLIRHSDAVEELRRASDSPRFFMTDVRREISQWVGDLSDRIVPPMANNPAVCILDNGVAREHPLLRPALQGSDCLTVDSRWGVDDHSDSGHGTNIIGTALFGDLTYPLADRAEVQLRFHVESVKFIAPNGFTSTDPSNYGDITKSAVALVESNEPTRNRVICMAVTNEDVSGERPTSWSAAVDQICAGVPAGGVDPEETSSLQRRLFIVSAGNIPDHSNPDETSDPDEFPIEDPGQAWNALTVGGFTDKCEINQDYEGWTPAARVGELSPYSRISTDWEHSNTPIKPEVVFEAGNRALSPGGTELLAGMDSLSLLTTNKDFTRHPLTLFWATSAATAQAAGMAGSILSAHPELWPETVRGLIVHSAHWTPAMLDQMRRCSTKAESIRLARNFGYGVPQLERALASAENDLALVAQSEVQPYQRVRKLQTDGTYKLSAPSFHQVHYYPLPWPKGELEKLGEKKVSLKVTLSYFVEPSPGREAPVNPGQYRSFGLRFAMKRRSDTGDVFRKRVNKLERALDERLPEAESDSRWTFGSQSVSAGSLHCDIWTGSAVELAARDQIAIYPVGGWWKYRPHLERHSSMARYSLIVSITSDDVEVKLYSEIAEYIRIAVKTQVSV